MNGKCDGAIDQRVRRCDLGNILLQGGTIIDGTGNPGFQGDVLINGDQILGIGCIAPCIAGKKIDVTGLIVTPGFIDLHTHTDRKIFDNPLGNSKVMQGVTTDVTSNCGVGPFPVNKSRVGELESYLETLSGSLPEGGINWTDFDGFAKAVEKVNPGINLAMLVAQGALRIASIGWGDRPPTELEMSEMKEALDISLRQGAWGMSTGLIYPPGCFAGPEELKELAKGLVRHDALYTSHIRGESGSLLASVEEAIQLGRKSGARVTVSHLKAIGKPYWGKGIEALHRIEAARAQGVDIWADQYPYEATATSLSTLVPGWAHDGGVAALLARLEEVELREKIMASIIQELSIRGGPDRVRIAVVKTEKNMCWAGKTIQDIATGWNVEPAEVVRRLLLEESAKVNAIYFSIGEVDLEGIITSPIVAVGSDGQGMDPEKDRRENIHPRSYGTFPRVLGRYVREKRLLSWEAAIFKMTGLPAKILRMADRGLLRVGMKADIAVMDPQNVMDRADFVNPHQYPSGIQHVFVNGTPAVCDGKLTGFGRGKVLRKNK